MGRDREIDRRSLIERTRYMGEFDQRRDRHTRSRERSALDCGGRPAVVLILCEERMVRLNPPSLIAALIPVSHIIISTLKIV